jgi:hypothetical protein
VAEKFQAHGGHMEVLRMVIDEVQQAAGGILVLEAHSADGAPEFGLGAQIGPGSVRTFGDAVELKERGGVLGFVEELTGMGQFGGGPGVMGGLLGTCRAGAQGPASPRACSATAGFGRQRSWVRQSSRAGTRGKACAAVDLSTRAVHP